LCGAIYFAVLFALKWLLATYVGDLAAVLVGLVVGWLLYVFLIAQFHVLTDKQICQLPCGEIMVMFLRGADTREE
jgi:xanthine/uracil permease